MLARRLNMPAAALFTMLQEYGWIKRSGNAWRLTRKGEFEGGRYVKSERFGTYIGWPQQIAEHRIFLSNPDARHWSVAALAHRIDLTPRQTALFLRELGWIRPGLKGWLLTEKGRQHGGEQEEDPTTGIPEVFWPPEILGEPELTRQFEQLHLLQTSAPEPGEQDLFGPRGRSDSVPEVGQPVRCIDGHSVDSLPLAIICQWLYLSGIAHSVHRRLPLPADHWADFYLPVAQTYIEYWGEEHEQGQLAEKLSRQKLYEENDLHVIDLQASDMERLDTVLLRELLRIGYVVD